MVDEWNVPFLQPNIKLLCTNTKVKMAEIAQELNSCEEKPSKWGEELAATTGSPWWWLPQLLFVASSFAHPSPWYLL